MVLVDVIVKDRQGRFVQGLTQDDFEVYEDGQPVNVSFFALERFRKELPPTTAPLVREGFTEVDVESSLILPRHLVLIIDAYNTAPSEWARMKPALIDYVRGLSDNDRVLVAVLTSERRLMVAPEFTSDPAVMLPVIENLVSGSMITAREAAYEEQIRTVLFEDLATGAVIPVDGPASSDAASEANQLRHGATLARAFAGQRKQEVLYTLDSLTSLATHLNRAYPVPGPKVMVLVSSGIPLNPGSNFFHIVNERFEQVMLSASSQGVTSSDPISFRSSSASSIANYLRRTIGKLNRQNYMVYAVSTRGPAEAGGKTGIESQRPSNLSVNLQGIIHRDQQEGLNTMAAGTGGMAFVNSYNFADMFAHIDNDTALRYVIGYSPPYHEGGDPDQFYKIEVRGKIGGLSIRAREGYVDA